MAQEQWNMVKEHLSSCLYEPILMWNHLYSKNIMLRFSKKWMGILHQHNRTHRRRHNMSINHVDMRQRSMKAIERWKWINSHRNAPFFDKRAKFPISWVIALKACFWLFYSVKSLIKSVEWWNINNLGEMAVNQIIS